MAIGRLVATALTVAVVVGCSSSTSPSPQPPDAASPLDGIWVTPRLTRDDIAAALGRRGFGDEVLDVVSPVDLVADYEMVELVIGDGHWAYSHIGDGRPIGGLFGGPFELVDESTVTVTYSGTCAVTYHYVLSFDDLELQVADTTCPEDLGVLTAKYESAPFHRVDLSSLVETEAPGSSGINLGPSTSSERVSLHPLGSVPDASLAFAEYLPPGYGDGTPRPLLVFLHGSGESADGDADALAQLFDTGVPALIDHDRWPDDRPFVVLMPQHVERPPSYCFEPGEIEAFFAFSLTHYQVDPAHVYLTGLSCGAVGAWNYLGAHTDEVVAAAVLIAGNGYGAIDEAGCGLGRVAIWAFHGASDAVVSARGSELPIAFLQRCADPPAVDARVTVFPDAEHDVWTRTYQFSAGLDIYGWMLGHSR